MIICKTKGEDGKTYLKLPGNVRVSGEGKVIPPPSEWPKKWNVPIRWLQQNKESVRVDRDVLTVLTPPDQPDVQYRIGRHIDPKTFEKIPGRSDKVLYLTLMENAHG